MKLLALIFYAGLLAQTTEPKPEPKITLDQQAEYLQARMEYAEARIAVATAEAKLQAIVRNMQTTCPLILNPQGRPECAKPEPKK
jgi:hypothetical protein